MSQSLEDKILPKSNIAKLHSIIFLIKSPMGSSITVPQHVSQRLQKKKPYNPLLQPPSQAIHPQSYALPPIHHKCMIKSVETFAKSNNLSIKVSGPADDRNKLVKLQKKEEEKSDESHHLPLNSIHFNSNYRENSQFCNESEKKETKSAVWDNLAPQLKNSLKEASSKRKLSKQFTNVKTAQCKEISPEDIQISIKCQLISQEQKQNKSSPPTFTPSTGEYPKKAKLKSIYNSQQFTSPKKKVRLQLCQVQTVNNCPSL